MATGWILKSLQCKSRAFDDVVHCKDDNHHLVPTTSSCKNSVQTLRDVAGPTKSDRSRSRKSMEITPPSRTKQLGSRNSRPTNRARTSTSGRVSRAAEPFFPAMARLPEGHPSRNVVEIIFHTSWSSSQEPESFPGRIEIVFKVQNSPRTLARFEEYRENVKSLSGCGGAANVDDGFDSHARCVADGNEVMRFCCVRPTSDEEYGGGRGGWAFGVGKGATMCTFQGSGAAHESSGGGRGRKAMLVCRVIAGRVRKKLACDPVSEDRVGFDSVSRDKGELVVLDSRAVLPCFLIVYRL